VNCAPPQIIDEIPTKPTVDDDEHEGHVLLLKSTSDDDKDAQRHMDTYDANKDGKIVAAEATLAL